VVSGKSGSVWKYIRPNGKCPADEFLSTCGSAFEKKFKGSFDAVTQMGSKYYNRERFKSLTGTGKPLWEFKEFDHRLYCYRECAGDYVRVILLSGWEKQKKCKTREENSHIETAKRHLEEYLSTKEKKPK
jgi:hypothetical protein